MSTLGLYLAPISLITFIWVLWVPIYALGAPDIFALHTPIQPSSTQSVSYNASAQDPTGVRSIVISERQEKLKLCADGQHNCFDLVADWTDIKTCNFAPAELVAACSVALSVPYPDGFRIGYRARATNVAGESTVDGDVYFAAGLYPWLDDPIPIYLRGEPHSKIDLVFIPDTDYGASNTGFMNDVTALVAQSFFSEKPFARAIRTRREMWNFYLTYQQGDAEVPFCSRVPPPNWTVMSAIIDSGFIVHKTKFSDCSGIGIGSIFSGEPIDPSDPRSFVVPVHEAGHSVFSLADEYYGGGLFEGALPEHNVFIDKATCRANALAHGWSLQNCKGIYRTSWWRSDGSGDLMEDTSSSNYVQGPSDMGRYNWWYQHCAAGNC